MMKMISKNKKDTNNNKICPSANCSKGSKLIGLVDTDAKIHFIGNPLLVSDEFITVVKTSDSSPESKFRFASECVQTECIQWSSGICSLGEKITKLLEERPLVTELPNCGIRKDCRWFYQESVSACTRCELVRSKLD